MSKRAIPDDLLPWALASLGVEGGDIAFSIIAGDASNRRYFRLALAGASYIVVEAPPSTEKNAEFLAVRELLERVGLCVPSLESADLERGYLLLGDLGDRLLLDELTSDSVDGCYHNAFDLLLAMGAVDPGDPSWPTYDRALLTEELSRFPQWFVEALLEQPSYSLDEAVWQPFSEYLIQNALEQPKVLVHRDFHSRNLMPQPSGELAVIDFQDAVVGPLTYDVVSLLRDCYIQWPKEKVRDWALEYLRLSRMAGQAEGVTDEQFLTWFDLTGLQRHIKVLGTFARLYLRDGKPGYLEDLALVVHYVREVLSEYSTSVPEVSAFADWFEGALVPVIESQPWSKAT